MWNFWLNICLSIRNKGPRLSTCFQILYEYEKRHCLFCFGERAIVGMRLHRKTKYAEWSVEVCKNITSSNLLGINLKCIEHPLDIHRKSIEHIRSPLEILLTSLWNPLEIYSKANWLCTGIPLGIHWKSIKWPSKIDLKTFGKMYL